MKVLIVNTFYKNGGAAVAARRLESALIKQGVQVKFASFYPENKNELVIGRALLNKALFALDRLQVKFRVRQKKWLYKYSSGSLGLDLLNHPLVKEADIVHLHWISFGFLNVKQIALLAERKPVVWTLHDMWAFTGGCHYSLDCNQYLTGCQNCFYLKEKATDSSKLFDLKMKLWERSTFQILTCSTWLQRLAEKSPLLSNKVISTIGNAIDTEFFKPLDKKEIRSKYGLKKDGFYVLTGAMDFDDERKGFIYLLQVLNLAYADIPNLQLITFGKTSDFQLKYPVISLGTIADQLQLVEIYNLADVFLLTSIQDNLPNTVMESMSCGSPVVAFESGGVSDMIDHEQNGLLAETGNVDQLRLALVSMQNEQKRLQYGIAARQKVVQYYNERIIADQHISFYQHILKNQIGK